MDIQLKYIQWKTYVSFTFGDVGTSGQPWVANIFDNFLKLGSWKNLKQNFSFESPRADLMVINS